MKVQAESKGEFLLLAVFVALAVLIVVKAMH